MLVLEGQALVEVLGARMERGNVLSSSVCHFPAAQYISMTLAPPGFSHSFTGPSTEGRTLHLEFLLQRERLGSRRFQ